MPESVHILHKRKVISTENSITRREQLMAEKEQKEKQRRDIEDRLKIRKVEREGLRPKNRSARIYKRGHMLEDHLDEPLILSDEDVSDLLDTIFRDPDVRIILEQKIEEAKYRITVSDGEDM